MRYLSCVFMALLLLAGCGGDKASQQSQSNTAQTPGSAADSLAARNTLYRTAADTLVARFSQSLKSRLISALADGGPVGAMNVCKEAAPAIADSHAVASWTIRRVSDRNRNPANRADTTQLRFLNEFRDTSDLAPTFLIDWQPNDSDSTSTFTYYQPIRTQQMCLKCHGDMQTLGSGVYQVLHKLYPMDKATGYRVGDIRGMFVVRARWPEGDEAAELLASGKLPEPADSTGEEGTTTPE